MDKDLYLKFYPFDNDVVLSNAKRISLVEWESTNDKKALFMFYVQKMAEETWIFYNSEHKK